MKPAQFKIHILTLRSLLYHGVQWNVRPQKPDLAAYLAIRHLTLAKESSLPDQ
jgi:hypothetical protein